MYVLLVFLYINFFITIAVRIITNIAKKYKDAETRPEFFPKKYPENNAIIGNLALHGINGVNIAVISLSSWFSIILVPIIPGTLHPAPTINGIKLFPLSPILLNNLSSNNAILDIYPVVSNVDIHVNNITSCGTNTTTAPTPEIIPSTIKLFSQFAIPIFPKIFFIFSSNTFMPSSIQSDENLPTTPTDK